MTTTDTATQAALAIVNTVKANPAMNFDAKNVTVQNIAAIIRTAYAPEQQRYAALTKACKPIAADLGRWNERTPARHCLCDENEYGDDGTNITVGNLRKLAAALRDLERPASESEPTK